jgi:tRNA pseudouridine55 synthase
MGNPNNGIVVIDKPPGISSAGVVAAVKRRTGAKKVGHAGTLDPFATGILVCLINQATRLARFLVAGEKAYTADLLLGVETDTEDVTGRVVSEKPTTGITASDIRREARRWVGPVSQRPPVYSALKHKGRPLYELARNGNAVQKPPRTVTISALDIIDIDLPRVTFRVGCSPGTYIRTLGADMGRALGCGGHLTALRRTASSGYTLSDAVTLTAFESAAERGDADRHIRPMASVMSDTPIMEADEALASDIRHGKPISKRVWTASTEIPEGPIRVLTKDHRLVAIVMNAAGASHFQYGCVLAG